jgi:hypothetical protein
LEGGRERELEGGRERELEGAEATTEERDKLVIEAERVVVEMERESEESERTVEKDGVVNEEVDPEMVELCRGG